MRWPWSRGGRHRGRPRGRHEEPWSSTEPAVESAVDAKTDLELRQRLSEADDRLRETESRWSDVTRRSVRIARLNRENHLSTLIDQALGSGPT